MQRRLERLNEIARRCRETLRAPAARRWLVRAQRALLVLVVAYLVYRLSRIGWLEVLRSLPGSPWFYVFFLMRFLALPVSELAIYELIWNTPLVRHFPVFVRKRVYNFAVLGYSGEAFLSLWARRRLPLVDRDILIGIKDNNLLSALTSNVATVVLIVALAVSGGLKAGLDALPGSGALFLLAFLSASGLAIAVIAFRRRLIALPDGIMPRLLAIHGARQTVILFLHAAMYAAALPGAPFGVWLIFLALQLVLSRIPFLPNQDLVFLGAALSLAPLVGASEAAVAGMLIAEAGLSQILNFGLFFATAPIARRALAPIPADISRPGR
ncbi:MAG: hypothetical protein ACE5FO_06100 [Parvularculaceae bacterium]